MSQTNQMNCRIVQCEKKQKIEKRFTPTVFTEVYYKYDTEKKQKNWI